MKTLRKWIWPAAVAAVLSGWWGKGICEGESDEGEYRESVLWEKDVDGEEKTAFWAGAYEVSEKEETYVFLRSTKKLRAYDREGKLKWEADCPLGYSDFYIDYEISARDGYVYPHFRETMRPGLLMNEEGKILRTNVPPNPESRPSVFGKGKLYHLYNGRVFQDFTENPDWKAPYPYIDQCCETSMGYYFRLKKETGKTTDEVLERGNWDIRTKDGKKYGIPGGFEDNGIRFILFDYVAIDRFWGWFVRYEYWEFDEFDKQIGAEIRVRKYDSQMRFVRDWGGRSSIKDRDPRPDEGFIPKIHPETSNVYQVEIENGKAKLYRWEWIRR